MNTLHSVCWFHELLAAAFSFGIWAWVVIGVMVLLIGYIVWVEDRGGVKQFIASQGGRLLKCRWKFLWFSRDGRCHYFITYKDAEGDLFTALCSVEHENYVLSGVRRITGAAQEDGVRAEEGMDDSFGIRGLDHVQLAMPQGEEAKARWFYGDILQLKEVPKPENLAKRGGVWFEGGGLKLHLGVEVAFCPALKAHPALLVRNLPALVARLEKAGVQTVTDEPLPGYDRVYVSDPFGNRIELLEPQH